MRLSLEEKESRQIFANELLVLIANTDRCFFINKNDGECGYFCFKMNHHLTYVDSYSKNAVNIYKDTIPWDNFTNGSTLKNLIYQIGQWIRGEREEVTALYSVSWGYTLQGMSSIIDKAKELTMIKEENLSFVEFYNKCENKGYVY